MTASGSQDLTTLHDNLLFFLILDAYLEDVAIPTPERFE